MKKFIKSTIINSVTIIGLGLITKKLISLGTKEYKKYKTRKTLIEENDLKAQEIIAKFHKAIQDLPDGVFKTSKEILEDPEYAKLLSPEEKEFLSTDEINDSEDMKIGLSIYKKIGSPLQKDLEECINGLSQIEQVERIVVITDQLEYDNEMFNIIILSSCLGGLVLCIKFLSKKE